MLMKFEGQSFSSPVQQILSTEETNAVLLWSSSYSDFNTARRAVPIARGHPSLLLTPQMLDDNIPELSIYSIRENRWSCLKSREKNVPYFLLS